MFLDESEAVANILEKLLRSENKDEALLAFQIAFDLIENEHQAFLLKVRDRLSTPKTQQPSGQVQSVEPNSAQNENSTASEDVQMTDGSSASDVNVRETDPSEVIYAERWTKIKGILSGETSIQLTLQFLYSHNK
jgi:26S proteasome regulatory subunit N2